jgi:hypothetical protein
MYFVRWYAFQVSEYFKRIVLIVYNKFEINKTYFIDYFSVILFGFDWI